MSSLLTMDMRKMLKSQLRNLFSLQEKRSFPLKISSVNVTKCYLRIWSHLLKKSLKFHFLCSVYYQLNLFFPRLPFSTCFFISNTFISNAKLKLAKTQANGKHHPEAEFQLFENYSNSSLALSSKNNRTYSKK